MILTLLSPSAVPYIESSCDVLPVVFVMLRQWWLHWCALIAVVCYCCWLRQRRRWRQRALGFFLHRLWLRRWWLHQRVLDIGVRWRWWLQQRRPWGSARCCRSNGGAHRRFGNGVARCAIALRCHGWRRRLALFVIRVWLQQWRLCWRALIATVVCRCCWFLSAPALMVNAIGKVGKTPHELFYPLPGRKEKKFQDLFNWYCLSWYIHPEKLSCKFWYPHHLILFWNIMICVPNLESDLAAI